MKYYFKKVKKRYETNNNRLFKELMTTNYCSNCGNRVEQNGVRANFCSKCGQNLNTLKKTVASAPEEIIDNDDVIAGPIDISKLKDKIKIHVDIDAPKAITVGELIESAKQSGPIQDDGFRRKESSLPDGKDLLKAIANECAKSKDKSKEID